LAIVVGRLHWRSIASVRLVGGPRRVIASRPYLMAAWGYTVGMAYMSFFGHMRNSSLVDPSGVSRDLVLAFKGFGLALAAGCLAMAWFSRHDQPGQEGE
jgi:hypothetical protein